MDIERFDFGACSKLVASLGQADLPSRLLAFLDPFVKADVLQLYCFHRSVSGEIIDVDYFGAAAEPQVLTRMDAGGRGYLLNLQSYRTISPDLYNLRSLQNNQAVWMTSPEDITEPMLRDFYFGGDRVCQYCAYAAAKDQHTYIFWLARLKGSLRFDSNDAERLLELGEFMAPLLAKHAELGAVALSLKHRANGLSQRLERKLAESGIELSSRERDVCLGILIGQQGPIMALQLGVAPSSITTYKKRAFSKIGIQTRQDLFNWCFLPESSKQGKV